MQAPYKYRGIPFYLDQMVREGAAPRDIAAKARLAAALDKLSPLVSQAAEHAKRGTPQALKAAARSLEVAREWVAVAEVAAEAARRIVAEAEAALLPPPEPDPAETKAEDDPTAVAAMKLDEALTPRRPRKPKDQADA